MITLKHLCQEFDIDPYPLRMFLRSEFGKRNRWRWDPTSEADSTDLKTIKKAIEAHLKKS